MKPVIFSGTTEGRMLSEALSARHISHIVCVATEYGRLVMCPDKYADIREGRLDTAAMAGLIGQEGSLVFDATHPYADIVSANICRACEEAGREYVRIYRPQITGEDSEHIRYFDNAESCAESLRETSGNILLTTGIKDIGLYASDPEVRDRLFVRVLPSEDSIRQCAEAGITGRQVIAMQGPFSAELNQAMMRQYGIKIMVTKSSGRAGGLPEKLKAAEKAGAAVYLIGRPQEEEGISVQEALKKYFKAETAETGCIHVDLVGIGPGAEDMMTHRASEALDSAEILFGASRMISPYKDRKTYPYYRASDIIPVIEQEQPGRIAVLFSGDTGFSSGALRMRSELSAWLDEKGYDHDIETVPGISSIAYFAALTGEDYTDAAVLSLHGRSDDRKAEANLIRTVRTTSRTFVLLSGDKDVRKLGAILNDNNLSQCTVTVGYQLSYPDEKVYTLTADTCRTVEQKGLYIVLITNPEAAARPLTPVISDDRFIRDKVPMTKESIRHLSILRLSLSEDSVLYDIGSGTGSVACEAAGLDESVTVYAIEMKEQACELIRANAQAFGLTNIQVIEGRAPEIMAELEPPTHAFIGGSSGDLKKILRALPAGTRVVINAVSLETMAEIQSVIREFDTDDLSIEQISVSRSRELGSYHLMTAENPVMIASFVLNS